MKIRVFLKKISIPGYFAAAFILSWGAVAALAGPANFPIDPEKSRDILPLLYISMLIGPSVAGILFIGIVQGKEGFKKLFSAFLKFKAGVHWYLTALFAAPLCAAIILT